MSRAIHRTILLVAVPIFGFVVDLLLNKFVIIPWFGPDTIVLQCITGLLLGLSIGAAAVAILWSKL